MPIERKFLLCNDRIVKHDDLGLHPNFHIIGEVTQIIFEERRITVLAKWQKHFSTVTELPNDVIVSEHTICAVNMRCDSCGSLVSWELNKASYHALFDRYKR